MMNRGAIAFVALASFGTLGSAQDAGVPPPSADVLTPGDAVDFDLEETSGVTRNLRDVRGRVVMLWYEDRAHTDTNHALKLELHQFIVDNHLEGDTTTYGIANVRGIDGVIRDMARTAIRAMASQYGIQILLDWDGALQRTPFDCVDGDANFLLVDRQGRLRYRHVGAIEGASRSEMYRVLRHLIREH
jgi:hypothetical protein